MQRRVLNCGRVRRRARALEGITVRGELRAAAVLGIREHAHSKCALYLHSINALEFVSSNAR